MKKVLIGVFAHPDDEGFGPSGSLYKAVRGGTDVHLLLATKGDAGVNCDNCEDLGTIRLKEWRASGVLIGAKTMHCFGYEDGKLCNDIYLELADKILGKITEIAESYEQEVEIELLTFDQNGLSGHLDHIAISLITTYVYEKLKVDPTLNTTLGKLRYYCVCQHFSPKAETSWILMPAGRKPEEIDETVDISDVYEKKLEIMRAHKTQRDDMEMVLSRYGDDPRGKEECFMHYKSD